MTVRTVSPAFWERLAKEIRGDVASDLFSRGRYSTDASIYQCFPAAAVCPRSDEDLAIIVEMTREQGLSLIPRGGGTSTAGQSLGEGVVVDFSKYLNRVISSDTESMTCIVEPGCTPSALNTALKSSGSIFPVDIASSGQATLGGMLGNNASGLRALRHGRMRDNIKSAHALLSDGQHVHFKEMIDRDATQGGPGHDRLLELLQFGEVHERAICRLWPTLAPGDPEPEGYELRSLLPSESHQNLARLLAGSEGTLALFTKLELKLAPRSEHRAIGVCRFSDTEAAFRAVPKIVALGPAAVELLDRYLLDVLATQAASDPQVTRLLQGDPAALLLVEFDAQNPVDNTKLLKALDDHTASAGERRLPMVEVMGRNAQSALWRLRREALTRAWSLKTAAQPVSFLEDGAVPLHRLADYAASLEALFGKYGVRSAFYGNVGQGSLNVRPILNLQNMQDRRRMRALADDMAELIQAHGGVLTSGHGLGIARGEGLAEMRGPGVADLFSQLKLALDPGGWLNPGKIIRPPRFDDELILRAPAALRAIETSQPIGIGHSSSPARALDHARRCSGLSLCRSSGSRFDCPSYTATREERDSPRGRANTMRLALSGQLGEGALASKAMLDTMSLCVSCKLCKSACPSAIDIPKMKADTLSAARAAGHNDRAAEIIARLPSYAARARRWRTLLNLRDLLPGLAPLSERYLGLAADRPWPKWVGRQFKAPRTAEPGPAGLVALFADTFNQAFEPSNLRAAASVLSAAGYGVIAFAGEDGAQPLCCGRTYYNAGYIEEARREAEHFSRALVSFQERGIPVVGLEPACTLMLRDEYAVLGFAAKNKAPILLFEEFVAQERAAGRFSVPLKEIEADLVLQSHCHERSLGLEKAAHAALALVPSLTVTSAPPSCCGLNGAVGMTPQTFEASLAMAELALFPAIRKAGRDAFVAATGFSCRRQIHDGLGLTARHPAFILELALKGDAEIVA